MKNKQELELELQQAIEKRGKLGDEVNDAKERLQLAVKEVNAVKIELYKLFSGLEIGDAISFKNGRETKTGVLTGFNTRWMDIHPIVTLHKKDGTLGVRTSDYFSSPLTKIPHSDVVN